MPRKPTKRESQARQALDVVAEREQSPDAKLPHILSLTDIAGILHIDTNTVRRHFRAVPGVIVLPGKRKTYRVPREVFTAWLEKRSVKPEPIRLPRIVRPLRWG